MFGRNATQPDIEPTDAPEIPDLPPAAVEKRPAREAEAFKPSTFASRAAAAAERDAGRAQPRLVRAGTIEALRFDNRGREVQITGTLLYNRDKPNEKWLDPGPGYALIALHDTTVHKRKRESLGTIDRKARLAPLHYIPAPASQREPIE